MASSKCNNNNNNNNNVGVVFSKDCKWDSHIASVIDKAVTSVNMLSDFFGNRRVKFGVKRAMLLALIRPGVEYASEVWWASSHQAASLESKIQIEVLKRSLHCKQNICHEILRAEVGIRPLSSWLDQRKVEWWYKLNHKSHDSLCRQAFDAHWHSQRNYMSWHKHVAALMNSLGMMQEGEYAKLDLPLQGFRSYLRWCIYERDATTRDNLAKSKSTLASYIQHYNEAINYLQPQPYLCTNLLFALAPWHRGSHFPLLSSRLSVRNPMRAGFEGSYRLRYGRARVWVRPCCRPGGMAPHVCPNLPQVLRRQTDLI